TRWHGWRAARAPTRCRKARPCCSRFRVVATRTSPRCARSSAANPMPDLEKELRSRRDRGRKLLIPYLMGGMTADWGESLAAVVAAGADAVEVGIPFSDPMIDGPVIQEAAVRALQRNTVPEDVLD